VSTLKPFLRKRLILPVLAISILLLACLLLLYRSGRISDFAFLVAISQFVLLLMGVATAMYNDWVSRNKIVVIAAFFIAGSLGVVLTVKQSDRSAAESKAVQKAVQDGLARIENIAARPDPPKDDLLAEIRKVQGTVSSSVPPNAPSSVAQPSPEAAAAQPLPSPTHFASSYMPLASHIPDHEFSFYPSTTTPCGLSGTRKVSFSARIGFSRHDSQRRLVIDLPEYCEGETAQYALTHRQEIVDRITADLKKIHPDLLAVQLNSTTILQHRHPLDRNYRASFTRGLRGDYFIEGSYLPGQN
jgi:hypothetical protein